MFGDNEIGGRFMLISVISTNYQCVHSLTEHLDSVFSALEGIDFEYIVVDNNSTDRSINILRTWEKKHDNFTVIQTSCTRGKGRQLASQRAKGKYQPFLDRKSSFLIEEIAVSILK